MTVFFPVAQAVGECEIEGAGGVELDVVYSNALSRSDPAMWRLMDRATAAVPNATDGSTGVNKTTFSR